MPRLNAPKPVLAIKLCGMTLPQDVDAAITAGATHIGLILVPHTPRAVSIKQATRLSQQISDTSDRQKPVKRVGVFKDQPLANVQAIAASIGLDVIQLHGSEPESYCAKLQERWPVIKVFSPQNLSSVMRYAPFIQTALMDMPKNETSDCLSWHTALAEATRELTVPWWLAGGLTADNMGQILNLYAGLTPHPNPPCGVDVASGIEQSPGVKDTQLINRFIAALKPA
jgi:phosphoribosylanthranilate isomerase